MVSTWSEIASGSEAIGWRKRTAKFVFVFEQALCARPYRPLIGEW
jgi:hypothetical protein